GATSIRGGQVVGDRVEVTAAELNIESLQDTQTYESEQMNASAQVTVGYGVSVSGSYSQSEIDASYASVTEQSGILAGDGGYAINVTSNTNLVGGIVTSTQTAEDAGRNSFTTGTLTASDIENHADYSGSAFGISGGIGRNGTGEQGEGWAAQGAADGSAGGVSANKGIGFGQDGDSQSSTTTSGINTANLVITDQVGQAATGTTVEQIMAGVSTDVTSDAVAASSGALTNRFDAYDVQRELDLQVQVTQAFDRNRQEVKAELHARAQAKADEARAIRMANGGVDTDESTKLDKEAASLRRGAMWTDMVAMTVFTGPDVSDAVLGLTMTQVDLVRRAATAENKIVGQTCEAYGQNCTNREVDLRDVVIGKDGNIYLFNNGIFNKEEHALATGARQNTNDANAQGVYYILNPETGNPVAEILYAGYDKLNDLLGGVLPLTSASRANQVILESAEEQGGLVNSVNHSRGSMTWTNALHDLERRGESGLPIGTVIYNGAAANALEAAGLVYRLGDGRGTVSQSTHPTDIVGRWNWILGGNPATSDRNDGKFPSSHSSYTAWLPPLIGADGKPNELRLLTDSTWGDGNHSRPVLVTPNQKNKNKEGE